MSTDFENRDTVYEKPLKRLLVRAAAIHRAEAETMQLEEALALRPSGQAPALSPRRGRIVPREARAFGMVFALLLASAFGASAQSEKNTAPSAGSADKGPSAQRRQLAGAPGAPRFIPGFDRLQSILTEEQRASLREAMQGQREKLRELEEKIRDARRELLTAGLTDKFDEDAVRQKAMAAAKLDAELTVVRAKAFSQMRPVLSSEQLEKLKAAPAFGNREEEQPAAPRRRADIPRDEHGLPLKPGAPAKSGSSDATAKPAQP
jgi:Spy/CpxP family protein refolding chaperone